MTMTMTWKQIIQLINCSLSPLFCLSYSFCFKERNPLSVESVASAPETTRPWSSTFGLMVGQRPISARCAGSSATAWSPCRDTSRATLCRTSPPTGASTAPTCTPQTSEKRTHHTHSHTCTCLHNVIGEALAYASVASLHLLKQSEVFFSASVKVSNFI